MKDVRIGLIGFGFMGTTNWGVYKDAETSYSPAIVR